MMWENLDDFAVFQPQWNSRTVALNDMIPEDAKHIFEFGAGIRYLETLLKPNQRYTASDLFSRGREDTLVCDLNEPLPVWLCTLMSFWSIDVIVLGGILEHVNDLDYLIPELSKYTDAFVISFGEGVGVQKYDSGDVVRLFKRQGYSVTDQIEMPVWSKNHPIPVGQTLFKFEREKPCQEQEC